MAAEYGGTTGRAHAPQPWRARVRDVDGNVLGAGILVGGGHVLTCAHAISRPDAKVLIDCGEPAGSTVMANVADNCWVSLVDAGRGDVALLELAHPLADGLGVPLRRLPPTRNRDVYTFGYPDDFPQGVLAKATLGGAHQPGDEWIRLNWTSPGERVSRGFAGAAVVDHATGCVIGMVVGQYDAAPADGAWMLPIETIVGHISRVADWVTGAGATDRAFVRGLGSQVQNDDVARDLTSFLILGRDKNGNPVIVVTGESGSARSEALRRAVVLSDPELRPKNSEDIVAKAPEGTVPPVGSIDVAIDASGRTVAEVIQLIVDRMGMPVDDSMAPGDQFRSNSQPMTLVLDGVDDAVDPDGLLALVKVLADSDCRVVLGFRRESSSVVSSALSWLSSPHAADDAGSVAERLERLAARVVELGAAERELRELGDRVSLPVPEAPDHAVSLRTWLTGLRLAARNRQEIRPLLESCERAVERALSKVHEIRRDFDEQLGRRNELRGLLTGYKSMAETKGLVEDIELAALYRQAHEALWRAPCDVPAAERLVANYVQAVRRKLGTAPTEAAP